MLAVSKSDAIEYVVYDGFGDNYPKWFLDSIIEYIKYDEEYECAIFHAEKDQEPIVLLEGDVFLYNNKKQIYRMDQEQFTEQFYTLDTYGGWMTRLFCAPISSTLEFVMYDGYHNKYDAWFLRKILPFVIYDSDGCSTIKRLGRMPHIRGAGFSIRGTMSIVDNDVFLRNKEHGIYKLDIESFNEEFCVVE